MSQRKEAWRPVLSEERRGAEVVMEQTKVERFLKLGYSHPAIRRVLESLPPDAQTNDILEELIKTGRSRSPAAQPAPAPAPGPADSPRLVSRGCCPSQPRPEPPADFRPVVIDGSNVAMSHGDKKVFSCRGIQLAVSWFWSRGLRDITVFVPLWRKEQPRPEAPITEQAILSELERRKVLVYTPSRCVNGKRVVCYDDRYIIRLAFESDGIVVSNDNYRDLQTENPQWKRFIQERLLMYTFANDKFMPPDDPLGRNGPTIDDFLRKKPWTPDNSKLQHCPYGKKCTYGHKCKFYHPERTNQSQLPVADELRALRDQAKKPNLPQDTQGPSTAPPYSSSTPPPAVSAEEPSHSEHQYLSQPYGSLQPFPCSDLDEAFSSMEGSMSHLYIQDVSHGLDQRLHSYSSGVASYSPSQDDYSLPGGGFYPHHTGSERPSSGQCRCVHRQSSRMSQCQQQQQQAWASCPALLPHEERLAQKQYFRQQPADRACHSLPRDPWAPSPSSDQRKGLRSQLSTLFPQSAVEQVMNAYPHISDISQLIALIQSYRTSLISF